MRRRTLAAASAAVVVLPGMAVFAAMPASAAPAIVAQPAHVLVVSHLNNPRQLDLAADNLLLIAEAGKGGPTQVGSGDDAQFVGPTGSVSGVATPGRVHDQTPHRVVTGLLSAAGPDGSFAVGSDGVAQDGPFGKTYVQITYAPPDVLPGPVGAQSGYLLSGNWFRGPQQVANISAFQEQRQGPSFESNPYAVIGLRDGSHLVADAAGNDVVRVAPNGAMSEFHVFPNITGGPCTGVNDNGPGCNYVPTSLALDRAGNVYVGGLGSEVPGAGRVTKLDPTGQHVLQTWTSFTSVTGVGVANDGTLYVSELEAQEAAPPIPQVVGLLTKVSTGGNRRSVDVPFPAGVAVDASGNVFVSAWSVSPETGLADPGSGQVLPGTSGQVWRWKF